MGQRSKILDRGRPILWIERPPRPDQGGRDFHKSFWFSSLQLSIGPGFQWHPACLTQGCTLARVRSGQPSLGFQTGKGVFLGTAPENPLLR